MHCRTLGWHGDMRWCSFALCLSLIVPCGCGRAPDGTGTATATVRIAAAADLKFALAEVIESFGQQHPDIKVTATYGSSGTLFQQLTQQAPFDLFLSADLAFPRQLVE